MKHIKRIIIVLLSALLITGCTSTKPEDPRPEPDNNQTIDTVDKLVITKTQVDEKTYSYEFSRLLSSKEDLSEIDLTDEYLSAASVVMMLVTYENNPEVAMEIMDTLMGPESPSKFDEDFLKNQFEQYPYVARSYFDGSTPENDYTVEKYVITVFENVYSRDEADYVKLYLTSGGADSERGITLRQKKSTGEWFLFSDTYKGLTAGIRAPQSSDGWN